MKLCNPARVDYPVGMYGTRLPLMTRLRTWSQRAQWLVCLCMLSFAFASFCNAQDLADPAHEVAASDAVAGDLDDGPDGDASHAKRCADCHNHHGAALPLLPLFQSLTPPNAEPMRSTPTPHSATTTRELRPPIV
jgi:hypothetical protein